MMKKKAADSKAKGKKPGSTRGFWFIAVRKKMLEFYSDLRPQALHHAVDTALAPWHWM